MSRKKLEFDEKEIDEILNLYVDIKLNGVVSKLTSYGVSEFNKIIANNLKYKRPDGTTYKLYKYNFWGGKYLNEDCYGKTRIQEFKKTDNTPMIISEEFSPAVTDIIHLVKDFHDKPEELTLKLTKLFMSERKSTASMKKKIKELQEQKYYLENQIQNTNTALTNLMIQSQSPHNSLNDMFNINKSEDSICFDELKNIFNNNNERIKILLKLTKQKIIEEKNNNVIALKKKSEEEEFSDL